MHPALPALPGSFCMCEAELPVCSTASGSWLQGPRLAQHSGSYLHDRIVRGPARGLAVHQALEEVLQHGQLDQQVLGPQGAQAGGAPVHLLFLHAPAAAQLLQPQAAGCAGLAWSA